MTITDEMVERALNATTKELPEGVQYALIRGLKAMGWEIAITGSHDVMHAALTAALEGREDHIVDADKMVEPVAWRSRIVHASGNNGPWLYSKTDHRPVDLPCVDVQALYTHPSSPDIARIRAEAVAEERERCARAAEAGAAWPARPSGPEAKTARAIAAAIRGGENER